MSNTNNNISVSMVESKLPPGFRFHPRDEELVSDYLFHKVFHNTSHFFIQVDLNKSEPWEIPESACVGGKEWYFYSQRDRKYATGLRTNRATSSGYWKATGKDRPVLRKDGALVGMRKTLVFYQGRAPRGKKTDWVMHEFRLEGSLAPKLSSLKEDWVLCRVLNKSGEVGSNSTSAKLPTNLGLINRDSTSLPALMDAYISFDHHRLQQVPCFSNNINYNNNNPKNDIFLPTETSSSSIPVGENENENEDEDEVLKALLNQLSNPNFSHDLSGSNIWTHY